MSDASNPTTSGGAHDESVEVFPIPGSDDVRVHGMSIDDLASELGEEHQVTVHEAEPPASSVLSEREIEILRLIATGMSNEEVAAVSYLSINTVKSHIRAAYRKMGVETRSQAVLWAMRHGLVDPDAVQPDDLRVHDAGE